MDETVEHAFGLPSIDALQDPLNASILAEFWRTMEGLTESTFPDIEAAPSAEAFISEVKILENRAQVMEGFRAAVRERSLQALARIAYHPDIKTFAHIRDVQSGLTHLSERLFEKAE